MYFSNYLLLIINLINYSYIHLQSSCIVLCFKKSEYTVRNLYLQRYIDILQKMLSKVIINKY